MSKTTVVHVRDGYDVYIGRAMPRYGLKASKWANPYRVGRDGTRREVGAKYLRHLATRPDLLAALPELRGLRLGCWCKEPGRDVPCHGDPLVYIVDNCPMDPVVLVPILEELARRLEAGESEVRK